MVNVLIAGGNGKLGRTITDVISQNGQHRAFILSRNAEASSQPDVTTVQGDYSSVEVLTQLLNAHEIHTIISTMQVVTPEAGTYEVNLVKAAEASPTVKRFIPSEWGLKITDPELQLPAQAIHNLTTAALRETSLEWTVVYNSLIADWLGLPHLQSHFVPYAIHVDMANRAASIPGTGDDTLCITYSYDIGKFVNLLLGMDKWDRETFVYSDRITYNEMIKIAEEVRGQKFNVAYDSVEKLQSKQMTELPLQKSFYHLFPKPAMQARFSTFGLYCVKGFYNFNYESTLNRKFPNLKTMTAREMMAPWEGKE